jgi:GT2 family glycosyltransferase
MRSKVGVIPYVVLLLPFDLAVVIAILLAQLCGFVPLCFKRHKERLDSPPPEEGNIPQASAATIVIVNWDGKHLLAECLSALIESVKCAGGDHEILVVDNGSTDGSVQFIRENFPQVRILALDRNYGFAVGNNRGAGEAQTDIVVFLNNDMVVERGFLRPLLTGFSDPSVFAVSCQIFFADATRRREETGKTRARFEGGFFYLWHDEIRAEDNNVETVPVFWAGGGSCAVQRKRFLAIGGFDSLYHPFYVEDTDLSYQAWKRGWKCLLAPSSRAVHKHRSTSKTKFGDRFVDNTIRRNQYLFIWKNVTDLSMVLEHLANLPRTHARGMIQNGPRFEIRAYLRAVRQLPQALGKRLSSIPHYAISDGEVLARSQKP